jgi:uncharacterized Tic20 family protein
MTSQRWERTWAMWMHVSIVLAFVGLPIFVAWALWLLRRRESALVDDHGRECLNIQLSNLIVAIAGGVLVFCGIGFFLLIAAGLLAAWSGVFGALAAREGRVYRAPMTLRLVTAARLPVGVVVPTGAVS